MRIAVMNPSGDIVVYDESKADELKREARSVEHQLTHTPKNPYCDVCARAKMYRQQARRREPDCREVPSNFGDLLHVDHVIVGRRKFNHGLSGERCALYVMDRATGVTDAPPLKSKTAKATETALRFFAPDGKSLFSDNAPEIVKAAEQLGWVHATSTPHRPQANSVTERNIRIMVEGTRANLVQSGLPHRFWTFAARHHCASRATTVKDGRSPYGDLHGEHFGGHRIPFGALIHYRKTPLMRRRDGKFSSPTAAGLFLGLHVDPGYTLRGDVYVISVDELEKIDDLQKSKISVYRIRPKEIVVPDSVTFPLQHKLIEAKMDQIAKLGVPDDADEDVDHAPDFDFYDDYEEAKQTEKSIADISKANGDEEAGHRDAPTQGDWRR